MAGKPDMANLTARKIAILATHGFEQSELLQPQSALRDAGAETRERSRQEGWNWSPARWLPRLAFGLLIGAAGFFSFQQIHEVQHQKIARSVSVLSEVASVPGPDALRDFEAIRVLDASPAADEELLRLFR